MTYLVINQSFSINNDSPCRTLCEGFHKPGASSQLRKTTHRKKTLLVLRYDCYQKQEQHGWKDSFSLPMVLLPLVQLGVFANSTGYSI